jgi:hypothetical protein
MKFTQTGTFQKNTLDKRVNIHPSEGVKNIFFEYLNFFLGFVGEEKPEVANEYVKNLTKKYEGLVDNEYPETYSDAVGKNYTEFKNLRQHPDLLKASLNYFIELIQLEDVSTWEMTEVEISMRALVKAWTYPSYYFLQTLTETIDREEAVKLFKRYITQFYIDHPSPKKDEFVNLEKMLENRLSGDTTSSEWVLVHTMLEDGKYAFKNKNCPTCVDAMIDLPDSELKYLVCCYGDYEKFRANYGDHLILTMEHTIMQGDPYCSRVLHDTHVDYDLRHPSKEFWDNFEPGKEETAGKYYRK